MEKISIIIPVYNIKNEISRCLDSVINQTYENLEIIVVNDGSTDGVESVLQQYSESDKRIKVINKANSGVVAARKSGLEAATGELIGFIDGDDYIDLDMYSYLYEMILKYNADIAHCGYQMEFADGRISKFYGTNVLFEQDNIKGQLDLLEGKIIEPGLCNKLFRKKLFNGVEIDPNIKNNEDLLVNFMLFKNASKSVFSDVCKYHYVIRSSSASRKQININRVMDPIRVRNEILSLSKDPLVKQCAEKNCIHVHINTYSGIISSRQEKQFKNEIKVILKFLRDNKHKLRLISRNAKIKGYLILYFRFFYNPFIKFYENKVQPKKSKYM